MVDDLPHAHTVLGGAMGDFTYGSVTDASCRVIDDASQCLVIIGIDDKPKIADGIFYLFALIE